MSGEQNDAQFLSTPRSCGNVRVSRKRHHGQRQRCSRASWGILIEGGRTDSHGSDLTTKRHVKERRIVLMTLRRLRHTRGRGDAVSTASEGQSAAAVNAVVDATWLKPRVGTLSLADPGGCELAELGDGHLAERGRAQHASIALNGRRSGGE